MKKFVTFLVVIAVLAGAGWAGYTYYYLPTQAKAATTDADLASARASLAQAQADVVELLKAPSPQYLSRQFPL